MVFQVLRRRLQIVTCRPWSCRTVNHLLTVHYGLVITMALMLGPPILQWGHAGLLPSMCFDMGNGASNFTAFRENGTTLEIGGLFASASADGNFTNVALVKYRTVWGSVQSGAGQHSVRFRRSKFWFLCDFDSSVGGLIVSGNVGIGSTNPGTALDVNGTARMTGFLLFRQELQIIFCFNISMLLVPRTHCLGRRCCFKLLV